LDLHSINPLSRLPNTEYKCLDKVREQIMENLLTVMPFRFDSKLKREVREKLKKAREEELAAAKEKEKPNAKENNTKDKEMEMLKAK
jgi:hypothetical protein